MHLSLSSPRLRSSRRLAASMALSLAALASAARGQPAAAPTAAAAPGSATAAVAPCPALFSDLGPGDAVRTCQCTSAATRTGSVWGSEYYTDDSSICRAAVHSGEITGGGGTVTIYPLQGLGKYDGTARHGVRSEPSGSHGASFALSAPAVGKLARQRCQLDGVKLRGSTAQVTCWCSATDVLDGNVFGTDVYSEESNICRAGVHAGVLTLNGGIATVIPAPGQESYPGSARHTVTSVSHGPSPGSYRFAPRKEKPDCWSSDCGASNR